MALKEALQGTVLKRAVGDDVLGGRLSVDRETALRLIEGRPWHHDFEIIPGIRTCGSYDPSRLLGMLELPADLSGLSVADVGASNGYFSFEARKRGARVVAFDFRHRDNSGFGLAQHINGMTDLEHYQVNVLDISPHRFGRFDIVLALGLLYHVADPYRALANCAQLSLDRLLVESYCIDHTLEAQLIRQPLMRFISDPIRFPELGGLAGDRSNFWGFTSKCLHRMIEDLGFSVSRVFVEGDRVFLDARRSQGEEHTRLGLAYGCVSPVPVREERDSAESWVIF